MKSAINDLLAIEFPLLAFTHCRDVVVEVSRAGGMGVFGAAGMTPEQLEVELSWIDEHIDGTPYGVDLIVPASLEGGSDKAQDVLDIPFAHRDFVRNLLTSFSIPVEEFSDELFSRGTRLSENTNDEGALRLLDVVFNHPIKLVANALGVPPCYMLERGKQQGVAVAALVGTAEQALKQAQAGVDMIVAAGGEAGGHCGEIATLVLVPEVCEIIKNYGIPVAAAGGIVSGRQMAACMAMGAEGAWTGSVWLTTQEAETSPVVKDKMLRASSRDTVRSKSRTGKYSRQLRSAWTDAWEASDAPQPLPMPRQSSVTERALAKVAKLAESGHEGARLLATYWVGQGVGMMTENLSTKAVVYDFMEDYLRAVDRINQMTQD